MSFTFDYSAPPKKKKRDFLLRKKEFPPDSVKPVLVVKNYRAVGC